jgi:hypothetical protein
LIAFEVGAWSDPALIAFAMAPNSAGAERAFSLLKILFGNHQGTALADSMMLRYNNTKRATTRSEAQAQLMQHQIPIPL